MSNFFSNRARAEAAKEAAASSSSSRKAAAAEGTPRLQPWVEKYRPRDLSEVRSQEHATNTLRRMVNASNLPHLLLYGPPGTGKTSTILALSRELFGPELFANRVLELNASDERGLSVIRERVKTFAQQALMHAPTSAAYRARYPCPPFKIIILDEADSLTQDAQSALRRTMEIYSKVTRFCLCCNYVSRIIDPVASRCSKFRFKALDGGPATERIREILAKEGVPYEEGVVERALAVADGDLRRAINLLQSASRLVGSSHARHAPVAASTKRPKKKTVEDDLDSDDDMPDAPQEEAEQLQQPVQIKKSDIDEIAAIFPPEHADRLIAALRSNKYGRIEAEVSDVTASGYSANEVLLSLYKKLVYEDDLISSRKKCRLAGLFSEMDKRLIDGVDEYLCLLDMSLQIAGILK